MESAKLLVEVCAGLVPGTPIPELTKRWCITGHEWQATNNRENLPADPIAALAEVNKRLEPWDTVHATATEYARRLMNPGAVNWVRLDWIWV
jgi:hypothetical protein